MAGETTWLERLFMNLFSYSVVLLPVALIVIATKTRLLPKALLFSSLIQWFVYGSNQNEELKNQKDESRSSLKSDDDDDKKSLLNQRVNKTTNDEFKILDFICCFAGLQLSYLIWGLLQEKIMTTNYQTNNYAQDTKNFTTNYFSSDLNWQLDSNLQGNNSSHPNTHHVTFHDSQFLVFVNRLVAFILAILALVYSKHKQARQHLDRFSAQKHSIHVDAYSELKGKSSAPLYEYIYCSLSNILSSWCQYEALKYVNFPIQCLSKSCKVIPVMLMSKILLRKRYSTLEYMCALLLAVGMFVFMLNRPSTHHHNTTATTTTKLTTISNSSEHDEKISMQHDNTFSSGLVILALYLAFDSFTSNWQQSLNDRYEISNWQMMAAINFYSILLTLTSLHQLGNLEPAFRLLASSSMLLRDCMIMSVMSSIGQMFVYYTIKRFGSVIFSVIMTLRQFLSILLSCAIYGHQLNIKSSFGLVLIFSVIGYQVWHKYSSKNSRKRFSNCQQLHNSTITTSAANPEVCIQFKSLVK